MSEVPIFIKDDYERYFQNHHVKSLTSSRTLPSGFFNIDRYNDDINSTSSQHQEIAQEIYKDYKTLYNQWFFELTCGFNLLFYGFGSKIHIMEDFVKSLPCDKLQVVINGFVPNLEFKKIIEQIFTELSLKRKRCGSLNDNARLIVDHLTSLDESSKQLFIVIHNINGQSLRSEKILNCLGILAQCPNIYVVASVDHVNSTLLFDRNRSFMFNWLWHDITTFSPYIQETKYEISSKKKSTQETATNKLTKKMLSSLSHNQRIIWKVLAENQVKVNKTKTLKIEERGLEDSIYFDKCRGKFLVRNNDDFKAVLKNLISKLIVTIIISNNGDEIYYYIPMEINDIEVILSDEELFP
ncbi:24575_t:CDS:1 [Entrophospora sp. SA101]|nr:7122_t:CDS:1 [Entrophospora sp. SA101]CAJ0627722.1 5477_t:CDS:1 [Entrophospora sp. SA101]CAJ0627735.1 5485_t:CDS:1 [Entrophospora sp. SA101]CAJ0753499.1 24575_t:CDS:1 [Entrophospora sp. SA101]CAJ0842218.1 4834_t:CDS:1 [Entrophospora sp. SA101]